MAFYDEIGYAVFQIELRASMLLQKYWMELDRFLEIHNHRVDQGVSICSFWVAIFKRSLRVSHVIGRD